MELREIASIAGKGGLFKVLKPTKSGVILESLDESKTKLVATTSHRLSILSEISIYTNTKEGSTPLSDILDRIHKEFGTDPGVDAESDGTELKAFLKSVVPDYDEARVYVSDIKKLIKWYAAIVKYAPEVLSTEKSATPNEEVKPTEQP